MVVSIQSVEKNPQSRKQNSNAASPLAESIADLEKLELITLLQSTLDLETLLEHFLENINELVKIDGLHYHEDERNILVKLGRQSTHSCGYRLVRGNKSYGELAFKRGRQFSESELEQIEDLVVLLLIPISNALKYADAVKQAIQQPITKTGNKETLERTLKREIELAKRHNHSLSLMTVNIKSSSQNKSRKLPVSVSSRVIDSIQSVCRSTDMLIRSGGREFCLIMHNDVSGALPIARRIERTIKKSFGDGDAQSLTIKTGCASLTGTDSVKSLTERARNQPSRVI